MPDPINVTLPRLWLASASPRRSQLLRFLGLPFKTAVSQAEEAEDFGSVEDTVLENARRKAEAVLKGMPGHAVPADGDVVIAADTLVALGNQILSKPTDAKAALESLQQLSGKTHRVLTGLALVSRHLGSRSIAVETRVTFRSLSQTEMLAYTQTPEPYDKAGGYGIQGLACLFVEKVEGSYSNVMGLPTEILLTELAALTGISPFEWNVK